MRKQNRALTLVSGEAKAASPWPWRFPDE